MARHYRGGLKKVFPVPDSLPRVQHCSLGVALIELTPVAAAGDLAAVWRPTKQKEVAVLRGRRVISLPHWAH